MPLLSIFRTGKGVAEAGSSDFSDPPPYDDSKTLSTPPGNIAITPETKIPLTADDAPQWRWTERQCQQWYTAIFVKHLDVSQTNAAAIAAKIKGWGPSLFRRTRQDWVKLLGKGRGMCLFDVISKIKWKKGGGTDNVPQWKWTERQCQEWCTSLFIKYLEEPSGVAEYMSRGITGWGPSLLLRSKEDWIKLLGEGRGISIYKFIGELKHKKGAVPFSKGMSIAFGKFADLLLAGVPDAVTALKDIAKADKKTSWDEQTKCQRTWSVITWFCRNIIQPAGGVVGLALWGAGYWKAGQLAEQISQPRLRMSLANRDNLVNITNHVEVAQGMGAAVAENIQAFTFKLEV